jgi:hypothetical protein
VTPKQRRFVEEYLVDLNATRAAIRAGYSEKTARAIACENLTKPYIAEAIRKAQAELSEATKVTREWVVEATKRVTLAAEKAGKHGDALRGLDMLGRTCGIYEEDNSQKRAQPENMEQLLARAAALGIDPETLLARRH